jgi:CheY-like chemotaxis protein
LTPRDRASGHVGTGASRPPEARSVSPPDRAPRSGTANVVLDASVLRIITTMPQPTPDDKTQIAHVRPAYHAALPPRVLVVAKDDDFRQWARTQLCDSGFEIVFVDDGVDVSAAITRETPALLVVDYGVPWCSVIGCLGGKSREPAECATPVLVVAPHADEAFVTACRVLNIAVLVRPPGKRPAVLHTPASEPCPRRHSNSVEFGAPPGARSH